MTPQMLQAIHESMWNATAMLVLILAIFIHFDTRTR